jgi:formylglycine-generating enzyme required for sulfatase activity
MKHTLSMVGNLWEWVADWIQGDSTPFAPQTGGTTNTTYGNDLMSGTNPAQTQSDGLTFPAAIERGESFDYGKGTAAGVFALSAAQAPSATFSDLGFRCGR